MAFIEGICGELIQWKQQQPQAAECLRFLFHLQFALNGEGICRQGDNFADAVTAGILRISPTSKPTCWA